MANCSICDALLIESYEKDPPKCGECWKREAIALRDEVERLKEEQRQYLAGGLFSEMLAKEEFLMAERDRFRAEVERLREALERASGYALQGIHEPYPAPRFYCKAIRKIARAALAGKAKPHA